MTRRPFAATALVAAAVLSCSAGPASAQDASPHGQRGAELQKRFAAADKNGDGRLTREEAQAGMPMVYKHFDEIDKDKKGSVALADIAAFARAKRAERKSATP